MSSLGPRLLQVFAVSALLVGCAAPATPQAPTASPSAATTPNEQGGTLRIAVPQELRDTDNLMAGASGDRAIMGSTVFDSLFASDEKGVAQPALATQATASTDALTWTLKLRDDVKFSNGKAFTASDVKANFDAILDPANASSLAGDLDTVAQIKVTGEHEVQITLKSPVADFPAALVDSFFIGDMDVRKAVGQEAWRSNPIGTGPYKFVSRAVGSDIVFERNDGYWRGRPPLDRVTFRPIPESQVAILALEGGEIDLIAGNVPGIALPELKANDKLQLLPVPGNRWHMVLLNFEKDRKGGYQDGLAFRQGIAHLVNPKELVPSIVGDAGTYASQPIPPWQPGHDPNLEPLSHDSALGVELLEKAGFAKGSTLTFLSLDNQCDLATASQATFLQLGYKVNLTCAPSETLGDSIVKYQWDAMWYRTGGRSTAAVYFHDRFSKALAEARDDYPTIINDRLEQIIVNLSAARDPSDIDKYAHEAANLIVTEEVAAVGNYWNTEWWAASKNVQGLKVSPLFGAGFLMTGITTISLAK
jgi:peptide/nickel transport system substrate-binding protein